MLGGVGGAVSDGRSYPDMFFLSLIINQIPRVPLLFYDFFPFTA